MKVKRILISQPLPETGKSPYFDIATKYGATVTFRPFIKVVSVSAREFRDQKVNILEHTAIIFTSRKAIEHFFQLCEELRVVMPEEMKYFCINEQIANYLQKFIVYRKRKVFFSSVGVSQADMLVLIQKHNKEKYFIPVAADHKNDLMEQLTEKKIQFNIGVMYRTVAEEFTEEEKKEQFDMIVFFSPIGVNSLKLNFPDFEQGDIRLGALGPSTAKAVTDAGFRLDLSAPTPQAPSMTMALDQYLAKANKK